MYEYSLNLTARSSAIQGEKGVNVVAHPREGSPAEAGGILIDFDSPSCTNARRPSKGQVNMDPSGRPKIADSKAVLQATETNPGSSLRFYCPVWFVNFLTLAKVSKAVEFCLMLPKYCKTFNSSSYVFKNS